VDYRAKPKKKHKLNEIPSLSLIPSKHNPLRQRLLISKFQTKVITESQRLEPLGLT